MIILMLMAMALWSGLDSHAEEINWDKLVASVIQVESGGDPSAVSPAGAVGLMQITPIVLKEFNETPHLPCYEPHKLYIPWVNKFIGTWYLQRLYYHYGCETVEQILAAYNGGPTRLRKNNFDIKKMPRETRDYVTKVLREYNKE